MTNGTLTNGTLTNKPAEFLKTVLEENEEWFIGAIIGTEDFLSKDERDNLSRACENVILDYLNSLEPARIKTMTDSYINRLNDDKPSQCFDVTQILIDNEGSYYNEQQRNNVKII